MTPADLARVLRAAATECDAIAREQPDGRSDSEGATLAHAPNPALLDRRRLARELDCSVDIVDRLRREGLPQLLVGDAPRFEICAVLEWLRGREQELDQPGDSTDGAAENGSKRTNPAAIPARSKLHGPKLLMISRGDP